MKKIGFLQEPTDNPYLVSTDPIMSGVVPCYLKREDGNILMGQGYFRVGHSVYPSVYVTIDSINTEDFNIEKIEGYLRARKSKDSLSDYPFEKRYASLIETLEILKSYEKTN